MPEYSPQIIDDSDLLARVNKCVRCGRCKEVCPSYRATREESKLARGRLMAISHMIDGNLKPSPAMREILDVCLKCHQCSHICPVGIDTVQLYMEGRSRISGPRTRKFMTWLTFNHILPRRWLYNILMKFSRWLQKLFPVKKKKGLRHIPLVFEGKRNIAEISKRPALSDLPQTSGSGQRIAFFTGCLLNYVYTSTAMNAVNLLRDAGFEVVVPKRQLCCGLASLYMGDRKAAARLVQKNADAILDSKAKYVVTACATCATMLKKEYPRIAGENWSSGATVMEISEFLVSQDYVPRGKTGPVAYHDPCHMHSAQGLTEEPRKLLSAVAELRTPSEAGRCCGGGGTFSMLYYGLSMEIGKLQAGLLSDTGARTVATTCPGCMLQLENMVEDDVEICHLVDIISRARNETNYVSQDDFVATKG